MEISPKNTEGRRVNVSDDALASFYVQTIGGTGKVKVMLERAYATLSKLFPHEDDPRRQWTRRRVRALWNYETEPKFREMLELHRAAERAKSERALVANARKEHAAFIEKTASLRALLERQDPDFHRDQIEGIRCGLRGMDRARNRGNGA